MTWSGYNTEPTNFAFEANKYADPYAKIAGVGCAGTNQGYIASKSAYEEPPYVMAGGRRRRRKHMRMRSNRKHVGGNSGYEFTNNPIAPVAGPGAPYSEVKGYNTLGNYRDLFPPLFKKGGSKKMRQYGCSKKRGGKKTMRLARRGGARRSMKRSMRLARGARRSMRRSMTRSMRRSMNGGMNSASDYTEGRNTSQDQPYGNKAISFGQGLSSKLGPNYSALASPPPLTPYNNCGKVMRN
jgi:hypothetical protein